MVDDALHSTMFLLIQLLEVARQQVLPTLHSTMFLLIQILTGEVIIYFTFHNVSINTLSRRTGSEKKRTFTFHNVSINTKPGKLSRA